MKQKTRRRLQNAGVLVLIALGFAWVAYRFIGFSSSTYTDDAQVCQRIIPVNSRIQGFVRQVRFDDYTPVRKGDTLVLIEDADFRLRLAQAYADLQNAMAGKDADSTAERTITNNISVTEAALAEVDVLLENARRDLERYTVLLEQEAVTRQQYDAVNTNYLALKAKHDMLSRQRVSTGLTAQQQTHRVDQNRAGVAVCEAAVKLAELNLSYTVITAPCDGYTSHCNILPGQLIQPGQAMLLLVDTSDTYVVANYRETQLARMAAGDRMRIKVDALPGAVFYGFIETLSNATLARYSPIPQYNATGNFIKVEQRIPVKIRFSEECVPEDMARLRSGMNVECKKAR